MLYKILTRAQWLDWCANGRFDGSEADLRDGFIHLSDAGQVLGSLARHFAGQRDLLLVGVDSAALGGSLRYEAARSGQLFPHVYGEIVMDAVRTVERLAGGAGTS